MCDWPAIDVRRSSDPDLILAAVDDFGPTAVEERDDTLRVFFSTAIDRDRAHVSLAACFHVESLDVADEDWTRRSQQNLPPVRVGRVVVSPPWAAGVPTPGGEPHVTVVIRPSMGFGTGHHATTRLCLAALQTINLTDAFLLDIGTGSGVLALAASRLGAARGIGIDSDLDSIQSANENLTLNPEAQSVRFELSDLTSAEVPPADVATANLTAALLVRMAPSLRAAVRPGGTLILSGILEHERDEVLAAFTGCQPMWAASEDEWVGLVLRLPHSADAAARCDLPRSAG